MKYEDRPSERRRIDTVQRHGFPVTVECDWIQPDTYEAPNFLVTGHWVHERAHFCIPD